MGSPDCFLHAQLLVPENPQKWAHYSEKPRFRRSMTLLQNNTRFSDAWAATRTSGVGAGCRRAPTGQHKDATMGGDITYQSVRKRISPCRRCIKKKHIHIIGELPITGCKSTRRRSVLKSECRLCGRRQCLPYVSFAFWLATLQQQIPSKTLCFEELERMRRHVVY